MHIPSSLRLGRRAAVGAFALAFFAPSAVSLAPQERGHNFECGSHSSYRPTPESESESILTAAQAAAYGTTADDLALHLYLMRIEIEGRVRCNDECPPPAPQTCLPTVVIDYTGVTGHWIVQPSEYRYDFDGLTITHGCDPCF